MTELLNYKVNKIAVEGNVAVYETALDRKTAALLLFLLLMHLLKIPIVEEIILRIEDLFKNCSSD